MKKHIMKVREWFELRRLRKNRLHKMAAYLEDTTKLGFFNAFVMAQARSGQFVSLNGLGINQRFCTHCVLMYVGSSRCPKCKKVLGRKVYIEK